MITKTSAMKVSNEDRLTMIERDEVRNLPSIKTIDSEKELSPREKEQVAGSEEENKESQQPFEKEKTLIPQEEIPVESVAKPLESVKSKSSLYSTIEGIRVPYKEGEVAPVIWLCEL